MIPVSILTGFLGSGKTSLIIHMLRDPAFGQTAVIVNEFGEVGLDHTLIASSDDSVLTLSTGCLCCAVQTDLAQTLMELRGRRETGVVNYDRVLIETSGLSDPVPMLQTMLIDRNVSATHQIAAIVTLVDSVHGEQTLLEHAEARHQVALADHLLISKTDLRTPSDRLLARLNLLNSGAPRAPTSQADPSLFFGGISGESLAQRLGAASHRGRHSEIETFTVLREQPLPALALTLLLQAIAEHCGSRMLRLKGLIAIEEMPERPAVIHGVRHVVSPPDFLDRWPSEDKRTRMVFIGKGMPRYFVPRLLDAIEQEVRDAMTSPASTPTWIER